MSLSLKKHDQLSGDAGDSEDEVSSNESETDEDSEDESGEESASEESEEESDDNDEATQNETGDANATSDSDGNGENESCPICLARFRNQNLGTPESCDHTFCLECILEWSKNINTCPIDRTEFDYVHVKSTPGGNVTKKVKVEVAPKEPEDSLQHDVTACEVCHRGDREDRLLLCDACDLAYHCECLDPPLYFIPIDEWFCPPCSRVLRTGAMAGCSAPRARRVIPRTRASETVRNRVQNLRTVSRPSTSGSKSISRTGTKSPRKRRRRTYRRSYKKVVQLARTAKNMKDGGKGKTCTKGSTVVITYKGRRKKYRRKKRKSTKLKNAKTSGVQAAYIKSAQDRIAKRLGLCKSSKGGSVPDVKPKASSSSATFESKTSVSLFGSKDQLSDFSENEDKTQSSKPSGSSSKSTNSSKKLPLAAQASTSSLNLLDTIMANQTLLYSKPEKVLIKTDGSVALKNLSNERKAPFKKPTETAPSYSSTEKNGAIPKQRPTSTISDGPSSITSVKSKLPANSSQKSHSSKSSRRVTFSDDISTAASPEINESSSTMSNNKQTKLSDMKRALWKSTFDNRGIDKPFQNPSSSTDSQSSSESSSIANPSIAVKKNKEKSIEEDELSPDYVRNKRLQFYNRKLSTDSSDKQSRDLISKSFSDPVSEKSNKSISKENNSNVLRKNSTLAEASGFDKISSQNTTSACHNMNHSETNLNVSDHTYYNSAISADNLNMNSNSSESQSLLKEKSIENQSDASFKNIKIKQEPLSDEDSSQLPPTQITTNVVDLEPNKITRLENRPLPEGRPSSLLKVPIKKNFDKTVKVKEEPKDNYENEIKNSTSSLSNKTQSRRSGSKQIEPLYHPVVFIKEEPISDEEESMERRTESLPSNKLFSKFLNNIPSTISAASDRLSSRSTSVEELAATQINENLCVETSVSNEPVSLPQNNSEPENMNSYFKVLEDLPPEQLKNMLLQFLVKQSPNESNNTLHETVRKMSNITTNRQAECLSEANTSIDLNALKGNAEIPSASYPMTKNLNNSVNDEHFETNKDVICDNSIEFQPNSNFNSGKNNQENLSSSEIQPSTSELKSSVENSTNQGISISQFLSLAKDANYIKQFSLNEILSLCNSLKTNVQIHHSVCTSSQKIEASSSTVGKDSASSLTEYSKHSDNEKADSAVKSTSNNSTMGSNKVSNVNYKSYVVTEHSDLSNQNDEDFVNLPATQINLPANKLVNNKSAVNNKNELNEVSNNSSKSNSTENIDDDTPDLPLTQYKLHDDDLFPNLSHSVSKEQNENKSALQTCENHPNVSKSEASSDEVMKKSVEDLSETQPGKQSNATKHRTEIALNSKTNILTTGKNFKTATLTKSFTSPNAHDVNSLSKESDDELDLPETQPHCLKQLNNQPSKIASNPRAKTNFSYLPVCNKSNLFPNKSNSSEINQANSKNITKSSDSDDLFESDDMLDGPATQPYNEKQFIGKQSKISSKINTIGHEQNSTEEISGANFKKPISTGIQWISIKNKSKKTKDLSETDINNTLDLPDTQLSDKFKIPKTMRDKQRSNSPDKGLKKSNSSGTEFRTTKTGCRSGNDSSEESDNNNEDIDILATQPANRSKYCNDKLNKNILDSKKNAVTYKKSDVIEKSNPAKKINSAGVKWTTIEKSSQIAHIPSNDSDDDTLDIPSTEPSFYTKKFNQPKSMPVTEQNSQDVLDLPETQPFAVNDMNSKCLENFSSSFSNDGISQSVSDDEDLDVPQTQPFELDEINGDSSNSFKNKSLTSKGTISTDEDDFDIPCNQLMEVSNSEFEKKNNFVVPSKESENFNKEQEKEVSGETKIQAFEKQAKIDKQHSSPTRLFNSQTCQSQTSDSTMSNTCKNDQSKLFEQHANILKRGGNSVSSAAQNFNSKLKKKMDNLPSTSEDINLPSTQPRLNRWDNKSKVISKSKTDETQKTGLIAPTLGENFSDMPATQYVKSNVKPNSSQTVYPHSNIPTNTCNKNFKIPKLNVNTKQFSSGNNSSKINAIIDNEFSDLPETQPTKINISNDKDEFLDLPQTQLSKSCMSSNDEISDLPETEPSNISLSDVNNKKNIASKEIKTTKCLHQSELNENLDLPKTQVAVDNGKLPLNQTVGKSSESDEDIQALILRAKTSAPKQPSPQKVCVHRNLPQVIMPTPARHMPAPRSFNQQKFYSDLNSKEGHPNIINHSVNLSENSNDNGISTSNTFMNEENVLFKMFKRSSNQETYQENQIDSGKNSKILQNNLQTKNSENYVDSLANINNNNNNKDQFVKKTNPANKEQKNSSEKFTTQNKEIKVSNVFNESRLKEQDPQIKRKKSTESMSDGKNNKSGNLDHFKHKGIQNENEKFGSSMHKNRGKSSKEKELEKHKNSVGNQQETSDPKSSKNRYSETFDSVSDKNRVDKNIKEKKKTDSKGNTKERSSNSTERRKERFSETFDYISDNEIDKNIEEKEKIHSKRNKTGRSSNSTERRKERYSETFDYASDNNEFDKNIEKKEKTHSKRNKKERSSNSIEKFKERYSDSSDYRSDDNDKNIEKKTHSKRNKKERSSNSTERCKERYSDSLNYMSDDNEFDKNTEVKIASKRNKKERSLNSAEKSKERYSESFDYASDNNEVDKNIKKKGKTDLKRNKKERSLNSTEIKKSKTDFENEKRKNTEDQDKCKKKVKLDSTCTSKNLSDLNSCKKNTQEKKKHDLNEKSYETSECSDKRKHTKEFVIKEKDQDSKKDKENHRAPKLKEKKSAETGMFSESKEKSNTKISHKNSNNDGFEKDSKAKNTKSMNDYKRKDKNNIDKDKIDHSKDKKIKQKNDKSEQHCESPEKLKKSKKHVTEKCLQKEKIHHGNSPKRHKTSVENVNKNSNKKSCKADKVNKHEIKLEIKTESDKYYSKYQNHIKREMEDISESSLWSYGNSSLEELIPPYKIKQEPLDSEEDQILSDDQLCNSSINYKGEIVKVPSNKRKLDKIDVHNDSDISKSKNPNKETDLFVQKFPKKSKSCESLGKKVKPKKNVLDVLNKAADDIIKNSTYKLTPESVSINGRFQLEVRSESPISPEPKERKIRSKEDLKEEIAEEVKKVLKPFYSVGIINKEDYKGIMRKAVPKIFMNCNHIINPEKIKKLVLSYVTNLKNS